MDGLTEPNSFNSHWVRMKTEFNTGATASTTWLRPGHNLRPHTHQQHISATPFLFTCSYLVALWPLLYNWRLKCLFSCRKSWSSFSWAKDTERSSLEPRATLRLDRGACLIHGKEPQGKAGFLSCVVESMSKRGCLPRPSHNRATRHWRYEKPRTFLFLQRSMNKANMLCTPSALRRGVPGTQFAASTRGFSLKCAIHCSSPCRPSVVLVESQEPQWLMHHTSTVNTVLFNGWVWSACVCSLMFYLWRMFERANRSRQRKKVVLASVHKLAE